MNNQLITPANTPSSIRPRLVGKTHSKPVGFTARLAQLNPAGDRRKPGGWVAERFKAPVLKTGDVQASVGSNPTPSANLGPLSDDEPCPSAEGLANEAAPRLFDFACNGATNVALYKCSAVILPRNGRENVKDVVQTSTPRTADRRYPLRAWPAPRRRHLRGAARPADRLGRP